MASTFTAWRSSLLGALVCAVLLSACGDGSSVAVPPPQPQLPPGTLDPSFGNGGVVLTPGVHFESNAVLLQPDGKIVVAGSSLSGTNPAITSNFVVARYNANGSPDPAFGAAGIVTTPIESGPDQPRTPVYSAALQPDGKIVVMGPVNDRAGSCALVRYGSDGTLDGSFGTGGKAFAQFDAECRAIATFQDGRIVFAGFGFKAVRVKADGSPDISFETRFPSGFWFNPSEATAILIQPDGRVLLVGWIVGPTFGVLDFFAAARFHANGQIDASFSDYPGNVGSQGGTLPLGGNHVGAAAQPDGKIVVAGGGYLPDRFISYLPRFNVDGSLDPAYGTNGTIAIDPRTGPSSAFGAIAVQANGKLVMAGVRSVNPPATELLVARYTQGGIVDPGFGTGGQAGTAIGSDATATAIAIQPDGRIVVAGSATVSGQPNIAVARYFGDPN